MRTLVVAACLLLAVSASAEQPTKREKRPLYVNDVPELGLRILTEVNPKWSVKLELNSRGQYLVRAATPARTYPAGEMVWLALPELTPAAEGLQSAAYRAILGHVDRYATVSRRPTMKDLAGATYDDLTGYEYVFSGSSDGVAADVRIFVGNKPGKPLVLMQATTRHGKIAHLNEQIRRSWTNVSYLDDIEQNLGR
jgi:hypothetical protein